MKKLLSLALTKPFVSLNNMEIIFELRFVTMKRYVPYDDSFVLQQLTCELIANGVAAIFGPSSKAFSDIVALIANTTGIPHMQYDWNIEIDLEQHKMNHRMTVNVAPPLAKLSRAYLDIIKMNFEWKKFTIYYETKQGLARLQDLMDIQAINQDFIKLRNIADFEEDIRVLWKESEEIFHEHRLIMDCEPESLNWFLTHLDTIVRACHWPIMLTSNQHITSQILGNQTMMPILMYDAVVLFANAARNIITNLKEYRDPYRRCGFGRSERWYVGSLIVEEMKQISEDDVEP
ncbi:hypothetical protein DOY81_010240, partial [Sarcophaga bullata]